jgi:membrane protease YdiL (CAAX protease family)
MGALLPLALHFLFQFIMTAFIVAPVIFDILSENADIFFMDSPLYTRAVMDATLYSGLVSIAVFYFMYRHRLRKSLIASERARGPAALLLTVSLIAIAGNFAFVSLITAVQDLMGTELPTSSLDGLLEGADPLVLLLSVCVAAPIAEELCFRALALGNLRRAFPFWTANLIQAALFGVIHIIPLQIGYAFLFGLLLGWIFHRTGRFGAAVLAHIVFNTSNILLGLIPGIEPLMNDPFRLLLLLFLPSAAVLFLGIRLLGASTGGGETTAQNGTKNL